MPRDAVLASLPSNFALGSRRSVTLAELNQMSEADFVSAIGGIFEHSPWVAREVAARRPFTSLADLHGAMVSAVKRASEEKKWALIRAHPDLAGKAARADALTADSREEQAGAGLDQLSEEEYRRFHELNTAYKETFGFPFIIAVKGHTKTSILSAFEARLSNDRETERKRALAEVAQIARFRLDALLGHQEEGREERRDPSLSGIDRAVTDLRYPIGEFTPPDEVTDAQRGAWLQAVAALPRKLRTALHGLSDAQLDTPYRPGGWTVRQVAHHLPDSHLNSYTRFKLALTEENPTIRPYDEAGWAALRDNGAPVEVSLALLDALHKRWVVLLNSLSESDWRRTFTHPASEQTLTLAQSLANYAWHGEHHLAHIVALREREGW